MFFLESAGTVEVKGATLSDNVIADRVLSGRTLWSAGVPINVLERPGFVSLLEEPHASLGGRNGVADQLPLVYHILKEEVAAALEGRFCSIIFDGSKINDMVELCAARFLDDGDDPVSLCIGCSTVSINLNANGLELLTMNHLSQAKVRLKNVVRAISDSAAINPASVNLHNERAEQCYFGSELEEQLLHWTGCLAHAGSNCGLEFRGKLDLVKSFLKGFKKMTNTSDAARLLWSNIMNAACPGLSDNRWWCFFDTCVEILRVFDNLGTFLRDAQKRTLAQKSVEKMHAVYVRSKLALKCQLRFLVDKGRPFRDFTYLMESDGFTLPFVARELKRLRVTSDQFCEQALEDATLVLIKAEMENARLPGRNECLRDLFRAGSALYRKFNSSIWDGFKGQFALFRAAKLFHPSEFCALLDQNGGLKEAEESVRYLCTMKGLSNIQGLYDGILAEFGEMLEASKARKGVLLQEQSLDTPDQLWAWWKSVQTSLPHFWIAAKILVLIQPASVIVERMFSVLKLKTTALQNGEYAETREGRALALLN